MSFFQKLFYMVFKRKQPTLESETVIVDRNPLRARTEEEKALEERVWQAQKEYRVRVLRERFAAQKEWMAKYEKEEMERAARRAASQGI